MNKLLEVAEEMVKNGFDVTWSYRQLLAILRASGRSAQKSQGIMAPTLVIHGQEDPLLPLAAGVVARRFQIPE